MLLRGCAERRRLVRRSCRPRPFRRNACTGRSVDVTTHYEGNAGSVSSVAILCSAGARHQRRTVDRRRAWFVVRCSSCGLLAGSCPEQQGLNMIFTAIETLGMVQDELQDRMMRRLSKGGADDQPVPRRSAVVLAMTYLFEITLAVAQQALESV